MYSRLVISFAARRGILHVASRLDRYGEVDLRHRLDDAITAGCRRLEVDCAKVALVEHPALLALTDARGVMESQGGSLVVTRCSREFTRAANLLGAQQLLAPLDPTPRQSEGE